MRKYMKQTVSLLLAAAMLLLTVVIAPVTARADFDNTFTTRTQVKNLTTVEYSFDITQMSRFSSGRIVLKYDADVFTNVSVRESMRFDVSDVNTNEAGTVSYAFANMNAVVKRGNLLTVTLTAAGLDDQVETSLTTSIAEFYYGDKAHDSVGNTLSDTVKVGEKKITNLDAPVLSRLTLGGTLFGRYAVLSWNRVENATGYEIYRSTSYYGTYTRIGATAQTMVQDRGVRRGYTYYYIVRAYRDANGQRIYSDNSNVLSTYVW